MAEVIRFPGNHGAPSPLARLEPLLREVAGAQKSTVGKLETLLDRLEYVSDHLQRLVEPNLAAREVIEEQTQRIASARDQLRELRALFAPGPSATALRSCSAR